MNKNIGYISSLIITLIVFILIYFNKVNFYIWPLIVENEIIIFADWQNILESSICYPNIDIYTFNPCTILGGNAYSYGSLSLKIPFVLKLYKIYFWLFPLTFIYFTIYIILNSFKYEYNYKYLFQFLLIFSTPILLGFERGQLEMLVFIFLYVASNLRNNYIAQFLILFLTGLKFYPAICLLGYWFKKVNSIFVISSLVFFSFAVGILFLDYENIIKVFNTMGTYSASGMIERMGLHIFSIHLLPELFKLTINHTFLTNEFETNQIEIFYKIFFILLFVISVLIFYIFLKKNKLRKKVLNITKFESKFFIFNALILISLYLLTQNHSYKEIYFLGLIPYLLKNLNDKSDKLSKYFYYLIIFKFAALTFLWIVQANLIPNSLFFKGFNIFLKGTLDHILMILVSFYLLGFLVHFLRLNFRGLKT